MKRVFTTEHINKLSESHKGQIPTNLEQLAELARSRTQDKHQYWKGDKVSYSGLHKWVKKYKGTASECSECGVEGKKNGRSWSIQWANKSHQYLRQLSDWIALCSKCHWRYDHER